MDKLRTSLIGLGKIGAEDHLPAILESEHVVLDSICDLNQERIDDVCKICQIDAFQSIDEMLDKKKPDVAVVAVPHNNYLPVVEKLAFAGVNIMKEKPFATTLDEAKAIHAVASQTNIKLMITLQRRFHPIFQAFEQLRTKIGRVFHFDARYTLNVHDLEKGWRAKKNEAGGGCLIDMGYHSLDLLLWYFGMPKSVYANLGIHNKLGQSYDVEDTCSLNLDYAEQNDGEHLFGSLFVSRIFPLKEEKLTVLGTKGAIELQRGSITRMDGKGNTMEKLSREGEWRSAFVDQIDTFAKWVRGEIADIDLTYLDHFQHVAILEAAYKSNKDKTIVDPSLLLADSPVRI